MKTLYCITGLGADEKVFKYLDLSFVNPVFIDWLTPLSNETLQSYATRIKEKYIHESNPLIFGLSLGGMIAVEIAKSIPSAKVIIISSAKTKNEIPFYWKAFKYMPIYKVLPEWSVRKNLKIRHYFIGAKKQAAKDYIKHVARRGDIKFYRWAIENIITWENETVPSNIIHIHGTNDKLLPYKFLKADIPVNNGGHLMVIENAEEISALIKNIIVN
ncbi:MAG TPA: alpha/beta hydrolase [Parafilimonas sp.]|nr:alpha/beta hydrolase [Parafilimonas sp.]